VRTGKNYQSIEILLYSYTRSKFFKEKINISTKIVQYITYDKIDTENKNMSSKEWREWHLTPNGWVAGTLQHDSGCNQISSPDNKVLTCIYKETIQFVDTIPSNS
jgi:hypothetical protein